MCLAVFMQHFISQREEFETARDSILVWLTEMDLQLTNIEHFSECDIQAKIKQLRVRRTNTLFEDQIPDVVSWMMKQSNMMFHYQGRVL